MFYLKLFKMGGKKERKKKRARKLGRRMFQQGIAKRIKAEVQFRG